MVIASYSALVLFAGLVTVSVEALGVFDPSMIHSRSLATSSSTCPDELTACSADPTCIACATEFASTVEGCFVGSATSCDDVTDAFCCTVDAVDGCEDSPALEALFGTSLVECVIFPVCALRTCVGCGCRKTRLCQLWEMKMTPGFLNTSTKSFLCYPVNICGRGALFIHRVACQEKIVTS